MSEYYHKLAISSKRTSSESGIVSTVNSFDESKTDSEQIDRNEATMIDMEAAPIAEVAELKGVPFKAVKSIANWRDGSRNA